MAYTTVHDRQLDGFVGLGCVLSLCWAALDGVLAKVVVRGQRPEVSHTQNFFLTSPLVFAPAQPKVIMATAPAGPATVHVRELNRLIATSSVGCLCKRAVVVFFNRARNPHDE